MENELRELLSSVARGDEGAFKQLADKYSALTESAVHRFAPSFCIGGDSGVGDNVYDIDDLRQYAAMALYRAASTYRPDDEGKNVSFGLYAKVCINNAMISELRKYNRDKKKRMVSKNKANEQMKESAPYSQKRQRTTHTTQDDPLSIIISEDGMQEKLALFRSALSDYEKEVFECYIVGKSVTEIAERLGKEEKSVSNALYRMKVKIRGLLKN